MIVPDFNSLCKQAELYYYDFISNESCEHVPEFIVNHIRGCQHCREQVNQLNSVLFQTEGYVESGQSQVNRATAALLKLHFAYTGKPVTCETVKPFLPSLLELDLEVRIPTPITAHLDNCQQCSEDLDTIRELNLNRKQLRRLSQLFAEKPGEDNVSCSQAQPAILAVVSMAFRETNEEALKHLCICPDCRRILYQYRETVRKECLHNGTERKKFPCEAVSATDIFDYAIPYGLDPAKDQYVKFRQAITFHMRACPMCLAKMQQLHKTVYGISERAESEVITVYHIDESAKAKTINESDKLYAGFPIRVEITNREDKVKAEQSARTIDFATILKRKVSIKKLKPLFKTAVAAAAVILIAFGLFFNTSTVKAVTIEQIYRAIEAAKHVHISQFVPGKTEPVLERWVSRVLNIYVSRTSKGVALWDIRNKVKKIKLLDMASVETSTLTEDELINMKEKIGISLGLVPFDSLSEVPKDAQWHQVNDTESAAAGKDVEVYELTWVEKAYDGSTVFKKWRGFVDTKTYSPKKIEWYKKTDVGKEYALDSVMLVTYLSENEIQDAVKDASF